MLSFQSLNEASSIGAGSVLDLECEASRDVTLQVAGSVAGSDTGWSMSIGVDGSLDGVSWVPLSMSPQNFSNGNVNLTGSGAETVAFFATVASQIYQNEDLASWPSPRVRYVRANLYGASNVTSFSLTATILAR